MKTFLRSNVRWNRHLGDFELRCESCASKKQSRYWPLTLEFWNPNVGMLRCRACAMDEKRARERARLDPDAHSKNARYYRENREVLRMKQHEWYEANREARLATQAAYYAKNRERINAKRREAHAARRVYKRDWMRRKRAA